MSTIALALPNPKDKLAATVTERAPSRTTKLCANAQLDTWVKAAPSHALDTMVRHVVEKESAMQTRVLLNVSVSKAS